MSKKQNKKLKQIKQRISTADMEKQLLKTTFPLECESLPLEKLNEDEQNVVNKCMNHEDLNDEEFKLLKATLQRYRQAIQKHKPDESIDAVDKTIKTIATEEQWLDILDNTNNILKVNVPFNGKWYEMEFEILPLDDSRVVQTLQTHVDLFKDYGEYETNLFMKAQQGQEMSVEEKQIVEKMQNEINEKLSEDRISTMNLFLANQTKLVGSDADYETRFKFWRKFPFVTKSAIFIKVEDCLGLTEQSNEDLFPVSE